MADSRHITRRAAIVGLATASVATPAIAQNIGIGPKKNADFDKAEWLNTAPAVDIARWHLTELTRAMRRENPGLYVARFTSDGGVTITFDPNDRDEAWIGWDI